MFFLIGWIGCGNPTQDIAALNGDATAGAEVYSANCAGCHGDAGEGVSGPALTDVSEKDEIIEIVYNGEEEMPSFSDSLSDQEIADVAAFVSGGF